MPSIQNLFSDPAALLMKLLTLPVILIALSVHEMAHAWAADKLGDPTARNLGRITLNPVKHLDPVGFICMLIFSFGWAKPVPISTRNFANPRRDMALSALAGPASNFLLGFFFTILLKVAQLFIYNLPEVVLNSEFSYNLARTVINFFAISATLNISLAIFNFLPVPPLDGSRILYVFLPPRIYFGVMRYERYITIAIFALLFFGLLGEPLSRAVWAVFGGMEWLLERLPFFRF